MTGRMSSLNLDEIEYGDIVAVMDGQGNFCRGPVRHGAMGLRCVEGFGILIPFAKKGPQTGRWGTVPTVKLVEHQPKLGLGA